MNNIDKRLLAYKPISITLGFDWENTTLDQRAQMRWDYIQEQKKLDPNYVGYDFPEHFSSTHGGRVKKIVYDVAFDLLVNTIGQVISARKEDLLISFGGVTAHGYRVASFYHGNKLAPRRVHRLLGCTFLPVPEELKDFVKRINSAMNSRFDNKFIVDKIYENFQEVITTDEIAKIIALKKTM